MKRTNKGRRFQPETLTPEEVHRLLGTFSLRPEGIRNRALIAVLYRTGLRINEALTLYPKDLDLERGAIRVLNGKDGKSRVVGVDPGAIAMLSTWLEVRAGLGLTGRSPCSACETASLSAPSTSGSCCRGSRVGPASRSEFTLMGYGTPTRQSCVPKAWTLG